MQQLPDVAPEDAGRQEREAWNVYIVTDDVKALFEEYSGLPGVKISRPPCPQDYGMLEFDVVDINGHRLVFAQPSPRSEETALGRFGPETKKAAISGCLYEEIQKLERDLRRQL